MNKLFNIEIDNSEELFQQYRMFVDSAENSLLILISLLSKN